VFQRYKDTNSAFLSPSRSPPFTPRHVHRADTKLPQLHPLRHASFPDVMLQHRPSVGMTMMTETCSDEMLPHSISSNECNGDSTASFSSGSAGGGGGGGSGKYNRSTADTKLLSIRKGAPPPGSTDRLGWHGLTGGIRNIKTAVTGLEPPTRVQSQYCRPPFRLDDGSYCRVLPPRRFDGRLFPVT
jgi:hypothetical protein